jgi:hypothetical protein
VRHGLSNEYRPTPRIYPLEAIPEDEDLAMAISTKSHSAMEEGELSAAGRSLLRIVWVGA